MELEELEKRITLLEQEVKRLKQRSIFPHKEPLRVIGKPLDTEWIPEVMPQS